MFSGNLPREDALNFFRYVGKYVEGHQEFWDCTLTGIANLPAEQRVAFIKAMSSFSPEVTQILKALILFPELSAFEDWKQALGGKDLKMLTDVFYASFVDVICGVY